MGSTYYHGRRVTTSDTGLATIGPGGQQFYIPGNLPTTVIAYAMGFLGGRYYTSGNVRARLGFGTAAGSPGALLGYTHEMTITAPMSYGGDGTPYTANLVAPVLLTPQSLALGATAIGGTLAVAMRQASEISEANENFYYKSGLGSTVPTNPIGGSASNEGHEDIYIIAVTNTAPSTPTGLSPAGQVLGSDTTPNLSANFSDAEEVLPNGVAYDYLNRVQIQVRQKSNGSIKWDHTYTANATERSQDKSNITYAGSALTAGVDYEWRVRHSDRAGAWSNFSAWTTFNINPGGSVGTPSGPTGKQLTLTPGPFVAQYTHVASLSANAVQVRLLDGSTVVATSSTIAQTVAPNGNISITWAQSGFSTLQAGESYNVQIRARDTTNVWSPWSASRTFTTNAVPTVPSSLAPTGGTPVTSLPLLTFTTSDADNTATQITGTVEITRADNSVVTRTATYNSTSKKWQYQVTAVDVPSFQTIRWRARASDGSATSAYSAQASFVYAEGPVVTVTSPAVDEVFAVTTPTFTWSVTGQVSRRVRVYRVSDDVLVHDSGNTTTALASYTVPGATLRHTEEYYMTVAVTNSAPLTGTSQPRYFSIVIPEPDMIEGFAVYATAIGSDASTTAHELVWDATGYPAYQFIGYDIYRRALAGDTDTSEIRLRRITSPLQTSFTDYHPRSGVEYEYSIRQVIQVDLETLESPAATGQSTIQVTGLVIASALQPSVYRANLLYLSDNAPINMPLILDQRQVVRVGARKGRTIRTPFQSWEPSGSFAVVSDDFATADEKMAQLRACVMNGNTFSYRDSKGQKLWVTIVGYSEADLGLHYIVDMQFREEDFIEGEPAE